MVLICDQYRFLPGLKSVPFGRGVVYVHAFDLDRDLAAFPGFLEELVLECVLNTSLLEGSRDRPSWLEVSIGSRCKPCLRPSACS